MNNQIAGIVFCKVAVFGVIAAVVASGTVAQARGTGPGAFSPHNLNLSAEAEAQAQAGVDRIPVTLSDPTRPALVKVSMVNGSITVKAHEGKEVIVEARPRNGEGGRSEGGPKRLAISTTGLSVEEENNEVRINTESYMRTIDVTVSVPVHTSLKLRAVNDGNIVVTGIDGELDVETHHGPEGARRIGRVGHNMAYAIRPLLDHLIEDGDEEGLLTREMAVEGRSGQADCVADVIHRDGVVAARGEEAAGDGKKLLAPVGAAQARPYWALRGLIGLLRHCSSMPIAVWIPRPSGNGNPYVSSGSLEFVSIMGEAARSCPASCVPDG